MAQNPMAPVMGTNTQPMHAAQKPLAPSSGNVLASTKQVTDLPDDLALDIALPDAAEAAVATTAAVDA